MRLIDTDKLCEEFKERQKAALNWKQQAIMNDNLESEIRADAVLAFLSEVKLTIDNAPTVDFTFEETFQKTICENRLYCPARPTGEWISVPFDTGMGIVDGYKCSVCDVSRVFSSNYCPNCGAKMKGAEE